MVEAYDSYQKKEPMVYRFFFCDMTEYTELYEKNYSIFNRIAYSIVFVYNNNNIELTRDYLLRKELLLI